MWNIFGGGCRTHSKDYTHYSLCSFQFVIVNMKYIIINDIAHLQVFVNVCHL